MAQLTLVNGQRDNIFNSMYGGYTGHVNLPPSILLNANFWDDQKIEETVTEKYVRQSIAEGPLRKKLDEPLAFGEGLTESTYCEWIMERTRKMHLILCELGSPEKIFDVIDGSWEDEDLPLSADSLERLNLGAALEKKFLKKQHNFLVRQPTQGQHIDYQEYELVPIEVIFKPTGRFHSSIEKVYYPRKRDVVYSRKRVRLRDEIEDDGLLLESFMDEVRTLKSICHPHIVSLHASYTYQNVGYMILSPCIELTLRSFLLYTPASFKGLAKPQRRGTVINWLHCLSDALAYLYEERLTHCDIKPSSIMIHPTTHHIYLADIGDTKRMAPKKSAADKDVEAYEYAAPELWIRTMVSHESAGAAPTTIFSGRSWRRVALPTPSTKVPFEPAGSLSGTSTSLSVSTPFERNIHLGQWTTSRSPDPSSSDVFSLGCVFLDILSFQLKRKLSNFVSHRTAKNRRGGRQAATPDASFHANLPQVETWIDGLENQCRKKNDIVIEGLLFLVRDMVRKEPGTRPRIRKVSDRAYRSAVTEFKPEMPHCGLHTVVDPGLELFGGWEALVEETLEDNRSSGATSNLTDGSGSSRGASFRSALRSTVYSKRSTRSTASDDSILSSHPLGRFDSLPPPMEMETEMEMT